MAATDTVKAPAGEPPLPGSSPGSGPRWLGSWWMVGGFALLMLLVLGWKFLADPSLSAPTRDPAWYTWRAQVILEADPVRVAEEWGPNGLFAGGYRVTVPLAGALLQQVVGIDRYTFSAYLMIGIPILTGLALGAALFRSRRDPLVVLTTLLATVALFLTTPYVGLPRQHHGAVPAGADDPVRPRGPDVVGREDGAVPDRHRRGVHASDDVRDLRRRADGGVRLPLPDEPVLLRGRAAGRRADADVGRFRHDRRPRDVGRRHLGEAGEPRGGGACPRPTARSSSPIGSSNG